MFNAQKVDASLNLLGVTTLRVEISDDPSVEDDQIIVTEKISVQVGGDYLGVTQENDDDTFTMYQYTKNVNEIANKLLELTT